MYQYMIQKCRQVIKNEVKKVEVLGADNFRGNIQQKMDINDDPDQERYHQQRETKYGLSSEQYKQIQAIVYQLSNLQVLTLQSFASALGQNIRIRTQTELLQTVFKNTQFVEELITLLLQPQKMMKKHSLSLQKTKKYVSLVAQFMKENEYFYQSYFLMLEQNSNLVKKQGQIKDPIIFTRHIINSQIKSIQIWFQFLWQEQQSHEFRTSLGFFSQIFIPFVRFQSNLSSKIEEFYEYKYQDKQIYIWLISHFSPTLTDKIVKYTHYQPIFDCLFTLIRISIDEQQWRQSLSLLNKLCQSAIHEGVTSDGHIEKVYKMIKQVKDNISKDKNGTVFAFLQGIIQSQLVNASLQRLQLLKQKCQSQHQEIVEFNIKFLEEIVHTYYVLLQTGYKKSTQKMVELRQELIRINQKLPSIILLLKNWSKNKIKFSNGQNIKTTPIFTYNFLKILKHFLSPPKNELQQDQQLHITQHIGDILELLKNILTKNRWNSTIHCLIQKIIGMVVTTELFKSKNKHLNNFLDFLIESFANKKYVFLNSTRIINQGDIKFLYSVCCKITKSFQGASKLFGIHHQYEAWENFVVKVLKNYQVKSDKTKFMAERQPSTCIDLAQNTQNAEKKGFSGYIDEADERQQIKKTINKIDIFKKWKNRNQRKAEMHRSGSLLPLKDNRDRRKTSNNPRKSQKSSASQGRNRISVPVEKSKTNKSDIFHKNVPPQSTVQFGQTQSMTRPQMERIQSFERTDKSSSEQSNEPKKRQLSQKVTSSLKVKEEKMEK